MNIKDVREQLRVGDLSKEDALTLADRVDAMRDGLIKAERLIFTLSGGKKVSIRQELLTLANEDDVRNSITNRQTEILREALGIESEGNPQAKQSRRNHFRIQSTRDLEATQALVRCGLMRGENPIGLFHVTEAGMIIARRQQQP